MRFRDKVVFSVPTKEERKAGRKPEMMTGSRLKALRRDVQVVFQDPYASLNPRMSVGEIVGEGPLVQGISDKKQREELVRELLGKVGLNQSHIHRYPHEFSGGQRQRIGIARALAVNPAFVVCDEPVSALDVSIQSQVLNLLDDLQQELGLTYLFIAHNLAVVEHISDRVGVMYLGVMAELAEVDELYANPRHPYTVALLSAIPNPDPRIRKKRLVLTGDIPSPAAPPSGCRFHTRCWLRERLGRPEDCSTLQPEFRDIGGRPPGGVPSRRGDGPRGPGGPRRRRDAGHAAPGAERARDRRAGGPPAVRPAAAPGGLTPESGQERADATRSGGVPGWRT